MKGLPTDSATWAALNAIPYGWTPTEYLLADLFHALAGEPHPSRPSDKSSKSDSADAKVAALIAQRERLKARRSTEETPE